MKFVHLKKRQLLACACIVVTLLLYRSIDPSLYIQADEPQTVAIAQIPMTAIPVRNQVAVEPVINATAAIVVDEGSGAILYSKNANTLYAPASTTKLMTALVARKYYKPGSIIPIRFTRGVGGTIIGLQNGEQYTLDSLLEGALISSANDAAQALAEYDQAGAAGFVEKMNATAESLHLENTHFSNASGFDATDHYSTARDLSILAREVLKDPLIRNIVKTKQTEIRPITGTRRLALRNTNQLLGLDPRVEGVKTGTTEEAGEVLVTLVNDGKRKMLFVVLGSNSRYTDTQALMEWVITSYSWHSPEEILQGQE